MSFVIVASFALRFMMAHENARRDNLERQQALEKDVRDAEHNEKESRNSVVDHESFVFEDLTDWEQEKFRYVL
ncbi:hypothetical protein PQX77_007531 [Marasmius sp. AFHP31]|nr:hypothetical protein PQX77_007531 [Marasmius sp. AFHP31]